MQYCIEQSPNGSYLALNDFVAKPAILDELFKESANGKFIFNRGYTARLV